jgi:periplasmic divalent cation tolerance protein
MAEKRTEIVVLVTTATEDEAVRIGRFLVESRLAACANVIPRIRSIYRWKGKIADEQESLIVLKSRTELFNALEREVRKLHSYTVPEVIAIPISSGSTQYIKWIHAETGIQTDKKSKTKTI